MHDPYGLGNPNSGSPGNTSGGFSPPPQQGYTGPGYSAQGQPYGQPSYSQGQGQPGYPPPPSSQGAYVSYGQGVAPPNVYAPPVNVQTNELQKLEDDSQLWLLVAAIGFWVGFGWVTGPLAWYFGSQLRGKYRALGHHPCAAANWAWGIGIISSALYAIGVMLLVLGILAVVGALAL